MSKIDALFADPLLQRTSTPTMVEPTTTPKMEDINVATPPTHHSSPPLVLIDAEYGDSRPMPYLPDTPRITYIPRRRSSTLSRAAKRAIAKSAKRSKALDIGDDEEKDTSAIKSSKDLRRSKTALPIDILSTQPDVSPPTQTFPPTHAIPPSSPPVLSLPSRLTQAVSSVASYIGSYFAAEPAIIEYSDIQIKKQTKVRICAEEVEVPKSPRKLEATAIQVHALVSKGWEEDGEVRAREIEMKAKPKRVREILSGGYCWTAEEVYGKEIRGALRGLRVRE